jgi:hypothetical protein
MKNFLLKVLLFTLPILILVYPIDILISNSLAKSDINYGEFEIWNDIYNGTIDCDIAIYGSSRAWIHFNPKIIEDSLNLSVYNFGMDGHNFWLQYLRHLEYIKYNNIPKHIIVSVDVFTLVKRKDLFHIYQFLPYMLWNKNIREYTHSYIGFSTSDYYIPLIRYFGKSEAKSIALKNLVNCELEKHRYHGFKGMKIEWNEDFEKAESTMGNYKIQLDSNSLDLFENFLKECKSKNINVILVYTPEFIEGQKFVSNRDDIINIYRSLAQKNKIKFLDYSNDKLSYRKELFYNASHLNSNGANLFTKKFLLDLKRITVQHGI